MSGNQEMQQSPSLKRMSLILNRISCSSPSSKNWPGSFSKSPSDISTIVSATDVLVPDDALDFEESQLALSQSGISGVKYSRRSGRKIIPNRLYDQCEMITYNTNSQNNNNNSRVLFSAATSISLPGKSTPSRGRRVIKQAKFCTSSAESELTQSHSGSQSPAWEPDLCSDSESSRFVSLEGGTVDQVNNSHTGSCTDVLNESGSLFPLHKADSYTLGFDSCATEERNQSGGSRGDVKPAFRKRAAKKKRKCFFRKEFIKTDKSSRKVSRVSSPGRLLQVETSTSKNRDNLECSSADESPVNRKIKRRRIKDEEDENEVTLLQESTTYGEEGNPVILPLVVYSDSSPSIIIKTHLHTGTSPDKVTDSNSSSFHDEKLHIQENVDNVVSTVDKETVDSLSTAQLEFTAIENEIKTGAFSLDESLLDVHERKPIVGGTEFVAMETDGAPCDALTEALSLGMNATVSAADNELLDMIAADQTVIEEIVIYQGNVGTSPDLTHVSSEQQPHHPQSVTMEMATPNSAVGDASKPKRKKGRQTKKKQVAMDTESPLPPVNASSSEKTLVNAEIEATPTTRKTSKNSTPLKTASTAKKRGKAKKAPPAKEPAHESLVKEEHIIKATTPTTSTEDIDNASKTPPPATPTDLETTLNKSKTITTPTKENPVGVGLTPCSPVSDSSFIAIDEDDVISLLAEDTFEPVPPDKPPVPKAVKKEQVTSWVAQQQSLSRSLVSPEATPTRLLSLVSCHKRGNPSCSSRFNAVPDLPIQEVISSTGHQGSSVNTLDVQLLCRPNRFIHPSSLCVYLCNFDRQTIAKRHFNGILKLLRAVIHCDYPLAGNTYLGLHSNHGILFNSNVLSPLLQLCSRQHNNSLLPKPSFIAHKVFDNLKSLGKGRVALPDHINLLQTLINYRLFTDASKYYEAAPSLGLQITPSHLNIMLTAIRGLGSYAIRLLEDASECLHLKELARYVDTIVNSLEQQVLMVYVVRFDNWAQRNSKVVPELSGQTILSLVSLFVDCGRWMGGVSLLESSVNHISSLGSIVVQLIGQVLQRKSTEGMKRILGFIKHLSEEQLHSLSNEYWELLLGHSIQFVFIQTSEWLFKTACSLQKPISKQAQYQLLCLLLDHKCPEFTSDIFKVFLTIPLPSSSYLFDLCERLKECPDFAHHLYSVFIALLQLKLTPPPDSLHWLLNYHNRSEKVYHWLASLVKQASLNKVQLDHQFYEKVLVELRTWGKDGEAISCVYKNLRHTEQSPQKCDESQASSSSSGVGSSPEFSHESSLSFSLEGALKDDSKENIESLTSLLKQSGSQGQFGAMAAILCNLPSSAVYSIVVLRATLSAIMSSPLKSFQGLQKLVTALKSLRNGTEQNGLVKHDLWLAAQIGIYLLYHSCEASCWKEAFYVLHCLHLCGIHYVGVAPPHLLSPPPSSCAVALKAITCCLKVNKLSAVMEVLNGCQFIHFDNESEKEGRADILLTLADDYEKGGFHEEAFTCIQEAMTALPTHYYVRTAKTVSNTLSSLFDSQKGLVKKSLEIVQSLIDSSVTISCDIFSRLISQLIGEGEGNQARELVQSAIEAGWYHVAETTPHSIVLPCVLSPLEVYLILRCHLLQQQSSVSDLEIICPSVLRSTVESCLGSDFVPSLIITSRSARPSDNVALLVSSMSLSSWFLTHQETKSEDQDKKKSFKRLICKHVVDELKPHYQSRRFKSQSDYENFIKVLSRHCFKSGKNTDWTVTENVITDLCSLVHHIMTSIPSCYDSSVPLNEIIAKAPQNL